MMAIISIRDIMPTQKQILNKIVDWHSNMIWMSVANNKSVQSFAPIE
jgi:hypothetical protein